MSIVALLWLFQYRDVLETSVGILELEAKGQKVFVIGCLIARVIDLIPIGKQMGIHDRSINTSGVENDSIKAIRYGN